MLNYENVIEGFVFGIQKETSLWLDRDDETAAVLI
jgi:hypothetical protein